MKIYPSDLTKAQRQLIMPLLPVCGNALCRRHKLKHLLNAVSYVLKTGCQWRQLPSHFPPWQTVYWHFRRWCALGLWAQLNTALRIRLRCQEGRHACPSAVVFDTQSVKAVCGGEERGFDGYKRLNGRKRFLLVDTLGLLLSVTVLSAKTAETSAAQQALAGLDTRLARVELAWADQGFGGAPFQRWLHEQLHWGLELTSGLSKPGRPDFKVAPRRWVVERTIAWLNRCRRLLCDFERLTIVSLGWIYAAMVFLMARRLAP